MFPVCSTTLQLLFLVSSAVRALRHDRYLDGVRARGHGWSRIAAFGVEVVVWIRLTTRVGDEVFKAVEGWDLKAMILQNIPERPGASSTLLPAPVR